MPHNIGILHAYREEKNHEVLSELKLKFSNTKSMPSKIWQHKAFYGFDGPGKW